MDETAMDFIKNKPSEMDALKLAVELELVNPAIIDEENRIYFDELNNMLIL
jgi:hypothetical protein